MKKNLSYRAASQEMFKSVDVRFPEPMGFPGKSNADGPIYGIEIMAGTHADGEPDLVYWSDDGESLTAYGSLYDLCEEHHLPIGKVTDMIARAFVERAGDSA